MEFNNKLQELRKKQGITQEELASEIYVSRTAISKWESGRGYPNIESLKALAKYFSVTVDELISSDEALSIAHEDHKSLLKRFRDTLYGLIDLSMILLIFLPLFASTHDDFIISVSLWNFGTMAPHLRLAYFSVIVLAVAIGALTLALQKCDSSVWLKIKAPISLLIGIVAVLLFITSSHPHPYAATYAFSLLVAKAFILFKMQ